MHGDGKPKFQLHVVYIQLLKPSPAFRVLGWGQPCGVGVVQPHHLRLVVAEGTKVPRVCEDAKRPEQERLSLSAYIV